MSFQIDKYYLFISTYVYLCNTVKLLLNASYVPSMAGALRERVMYIIKV